MSNRHSTFSTPRRRFSSKTLLYFLPGLLLVFLVANICLETGCQSSSLPAFVETAVYNNSTRILPLSKEEIELVGTVQTWAAQAGRAAPELDGGLTYVARSVVEELRSRGPNLLSEFNNTLVQEKMVKYGVSDSAFRTQVAMSFRLSDWETQSADALRTELATGRYTHFGISVVWNWWPPGYYIMLILSRRPVALDPFPKKAAEFDRVELSGTLLEGLKKPTAFVSPPQGTVVENLLDIKPDGSFQTHIFFNNGPGIYRVEIAGEGSMGPEIVALMPVEVGNVKEVESAPIEVPIEENEEKAKILIFSLINRERKAAGLNELKMDPALGKIAQSHADEMQRLKYAAHRSPTTGMAADRANTAGIPWLRIGENVAVNQSALQAHQSLMESPAHRANVLDPAFEYIGLGIVFDDDNHGNRQVYLVENYAKLQNR